MIVSKVNEVNKVSDKLLPGLVWQGPVERTGRNIDWQKDGEVMLHGYTPKRFAVIGGSSRTLRQRYLYYNHWDYSSLQPLVSSLFLMRPVER